MRVRAGRDRCPLGGVRQRRPVARVAWTVWWKVLRRNRRSGSSRSGGRNHGTPSRITITQASPSSALGLGVDLAVVAVAEQGQVVDRGGSAAGPPDHVVGLAQRRRGGAAGPGAAAVAGGEGDLLRGGGEPADGVHRQHPTLPCPGRRGRSRRRRRSGSGRRGRPGRRRSCTAAPAPSVPASCSGVVTTTTRGTARAARAAGSPARASVVGVAAVVAAPRPRNSAAASAITPRASTRR